MSLDTRVESLSRVVLDQPRTISKAIISMQDGNSLIMRRSRLVTLVQNKVFRLKFFLL